MLKYCNVLKCFLKYIMLFPIRCFSCGRVIAHKWEEYEKRVEKGEDSIKVLDEMGFIDYCCKRMFLTHGQDKINLLVKRE